MNDFERIVAAANAAQRALESGNAQMCRAIAGLSALPIEMSPQLEPYGMQLLVGEAMWAELRKLRDQDPA